MSQNSLLAKLKDLQLRFEEVGTLITDPAVIADQRRYVKLTKEYSDLEKINNAMLQYELDNHRKPIVALMGLAFKPNIDDLRESPAKYIVTKVLQGHSNASIMVVEPNVMEHNEFKLTGYQEAYEKADVVAFLTAHDQFKELPWRDDKVILDFCGIFKK